MTTYAPTDARWRADVAWRAVVADALAGIIPADALTFAELHDHVDANEYLILATDDVFAVSDCAEDDWFPLCDAVADVLHARLASGALRRAVDAARARA